MTRRVRYLLTIVLPFAILLVAPTIPGMVLLLGQEIRMRTEPVDPRDPFRGEYLTLRFAAETLPLSLLKDKSLSGSATDQERKDLLMNRDKWFVSLQETDGFWGPVALESEPPEKGVYLRVHRVGYNQLKNVVFLSYGPAMERFYLKERTGRALEKAARQGKLEAIVKVWRGRPVLVSLDLIP